jgi:hypothetical protein
LSAKQAALAESRAAVGRVPQAEAELTQLNRDYDVVRRKYETLVSRREAAAVGAKLDQGSRLADFRVVEPSRVADSPVFPARAHLAWLAVVLTAAVALSTGSAMRMLRPTADTATALASACSRPVIGSVSMQGDPLQQRRDAVELQALMAGIVVVILAQVGWAAWMTWRAGAPLGGA